MSMSIDGLSPSGVGALTPLSFEQVGGPSDTGGSTGAPSFAQSLAGAVENLQQLQSASNELAVQAVTGDLDDIHRATLASARAGVTLDLVVAVRDRGVAAFNDIMRMQA